MGINLLLLFVSLTTFSKADDLSDCKCWEGYKAKKTDDGVRCIGVLLLHAMECNEPKRPDCKCTGNVGGILYDTTGTWCTKNEKEELKKWACENKEEWETFFKEYPDEKH